MTNGTPEERLERWREWLEEDLFKQVHELVRQREVFKSWNEIVDVASPESKRHGLFHTWVNHNYIDSLVMGVRRMSDPDSRTRSLVRFLSEIEEHVTDLTADWWAARWLPEGDEPTSEYLAKFTELSSGYGHIDPAVVRADREKVEEVYDALKPFVDKNVAHLDHPEERSNVEMITLGDIHAAAAVIYEVFHRWYELIVPVVLSVPMAEYWEHVLAVQWIDEEQAFEVITRRQAEGDDLERRLR